MPVEFFACAARGRTEQENFIICDIERDEYGLLARVDMSRICHVVVEVHDVMSTDQALGLLMGAMADNGLEVRVREWRGNVLLFERRCAARLDGTKRLNKSQS